MPPWNKNDVPQQRGRPAGRRSTVAKRAMDLSLIALSLPFLLPLFAAIALIGWKIQGSPILFKQQRPGLYGRPFWIYKFRTMRDLPAGSADSDTDRLTVFGRWLRSTSLDELPELLNVVKGEMSLVGPRPLLMEYLAYYTAELHRRHDVLPGLTGWAQVNGRNTTSWEQRFALDLWYVDHHTFALDCQILGRTLWKVCTREGIIPPGDPRTSEQRFRGLPSNRTQA